MGTRCRNREARKEKTNGDEKTGLHISRVAGGDFNYSSSDGYFDSSSQQGQGSGQKFLFVKLTKSSFWLQQCSGLWYYDDYVVAGMWDVPGQYTGDGSEGDEAKTANTNGVSLERYTASRDTATKGRGLYYCPSIAKFLRQQFFLQPSGCEHEYKRSQFGRSRHYFLRSKFFCWSCTQAPIILAMQGPREREMAAPMTIGARKIPICWHMVRADFQRYATLPVVYIFVISAI